MAKPLESSILIDAPLSEVWAILTDFARYPDWNPFIIAIEGRPLAGSRLKVTIEPPGGKPSVFRPTVLAAVENREFRWLGRTLLPGLFDGHHQFFLEDTDAGTRFVQREDFSGLLARPLLKVMGESVLNGFNQMNEALKERAEQGEDLSKANRGGDNDDGSES